jgi:hypothetical protein
MTCTWTTAKSTKWIAHLKVDGIIFTSDKPWARKSQAKLDAADLACHWFAFGRTLQMAPRLPFEDTPAQCIIRRCQKEKRQRRATRASALETARYSAIHNSTTEVDPVSLGHVYW